MVTMAFSVRGYCRTCNVVTARKPSTRMRRLTTIAPSTGRRMKISVNFMGLTPYSSTGLGLGSFLGSTVLLTAIGMPLRSFI